MNWSRLCAVLIFPLASACGSSEDEGSPSEPSDGCTRGELELDLQKVPTSLPIVPAADPPAEGYVVSSTYLRLRHEEGAKRRFVELNAAIITDLVARPGLLAVEFGIAGQCNTARTRSVWASTEAMYDFVAGEAHGAAVQAIDELSRGGSVVTHWTAKTLDETSWEEAAVRLRGDKGPVY